MNPEAQIFIAADASGATVAIRPVGACTSRVCAALAPLILRLKGPDTRCLCFDLSAGTSIDSTFIGTLLKLATRRTDESPAVHLVAPTAAITEALRRMSVLELFDLQSALPCAMTAWAEMPVEPVAPEQLADLVIEAHERLCQTDPRNAEQFAGVVKLFRAQRGPRRDA